MSERGRENIKELKNGNHNNRNLAFPPPLILKIGSSLTILIFIGLAIHLILPQLSSVEASFQVLRTMVLWAVLLAALAQIISYLGSGYLIYSAVALVDQSISVLKGVIITLAASSIGMLAGGTFGNSVATYRWVKKYGVSAEGSELAGTLPHNI